MATNLTTVDITKEEARILDSTNNDFFEHGKTDVKCPRCGGNIITADYGTSYSIGCEFNCINLVYRGI
jgi:predicted RNA-binding Zn-ribbon protein involved in translation (DUF1610 family)